MTGEELFKLIKQEDTRYKIYVEEECKGNIDPIERQKHMNFEQIIQRFMDMERDLPIA